MSEPLAEHEPLADAGVRALLERYVALSGGALRELAPHRYELRVPPADRAAFAGRELIRLAFSVQALEDDPGAEMAVVGSAFVEQLIAAVRGRGARRSFGLVPPSVAPAAEEARLPVPVANGAAGVPATRLTRHPVGRLTARVTLRAGAALVEHLVDSGLFDLATGAALPADVADACERAVAGAVAGANAAASAGGTDALPARPVREIVALMLGDLERRLAPEAERQRAAAERELTQELSRIDRYYMTLLADSAGSRSEIPDADARRAVEAEHERRRQEEIQRHDVRAAVHPVQLAEWVVPVQRAEWLLTTPEGHRATLVAQRALVGGGSWALPCPTCAAASPAAFVVCREGHAGCDACGRRCAVCAAGFCRDHGLLACHVDGAPACREHARRCHSCRRAHCSAHEGPCADGDHPACSACLAPCAHCGRVVCDSHATATAPGAPLGVRRLCASCVRHCEGGTGEVVGPDEVTRCASCDRVVCLRHQTTCAVDGQVHCSAHMRRTDRSRRLVCAHDRAACALEPNAIFARDEVAPCPVCARVVCTSHRRECANCGRAVCTADLDSGGRTCLTCRQLARVDDPDDPMLRAATAALRPGDRPKSWRAARDATHRVVELDLGWTRRVVLTLRHGAEVPDEVMRHSLLGRSRG